MASDQGEKRRHSGATTDFINAEQSLINELYTTGYTQFSITSIVAIVEVYLAFPRSSYGATFPHRAKYHTVCLGDTVLIPPCIQAT